MNPELGRTVLIAGVFAGSTSFAGCGDDGSMGSDAGAGGSGAGASAGGMAAGGSTGGEGGGDGQGGTASGGAGRGGGGGGAPIGSAGCGRGSADPTEQWVAKTLVLGQTTREYFVYLPPGYDPDQVYPVIYQFHGCSSSPDKQNNNPPIQDHSGPDAIHVRGRAVDNCWDTAPKGPDIAFFDALVEDVEASWCADVDRRFATGYSGGAFMTHRLACERGDVLRGVASIAGGLAGNDCVGQTAALLIHDDTDPTVDISASESARDRHVQNNGCDAAAEPTPTVPAPCVEYVDCDAGYPVVWCQTTGQGHSRQDALSAPAFWSFLSDLEQSAR
jgi:polyhydroxybutyrate depolymerase